MRILRFASIVAVATLAVACKKKPAPGISDAGVTPANIASSAASGSGTRRFGKPPMPRDAGLGEAGTGTAPPPLPLASDKLELVAVGTSGASKVLWLQAHGSRVWLSGRNLDAFADGDGPLAKGPDPLAKLDYKPGIHRMQVVGAWPHLFLLRTKNVNGRMESPEATAFVYTADAGSGTWAKAKPLPVDNYPWAFIAFRDGALVVHSQNQGNASPSFYLPGPGTSLYLVGADGAVTEPKLDVPEGFMAWSASADNGVLSMLGTTAKHGAKGVEEGTAEGVDLVHVAPEGTTTVRVQRAWESLWSYSSHVVERSGTTLVVPPDETTQEAWKPTGMTHFVLDGAKTKPRPVSGTECGARDAVVIGDALYSLRHCLADVSFDSVLVRLGADDKTSKVALPSLVAKAKKDGGGFRAAVDAAEGKTHGHPCSPTTLTLRGTSDLWVAATCGQDAIPAVFRLGRPQEPVILP